MELRRLGSTDLSVSSIGLGCVTFGREIDEPTSYEVLDHALAHGINLLDTAEAYAAGASEEVIGRWLQKSGRRHQIVLATKVAGSLTKERIIRSAEASLKRLQTDHIDLFQLHHWDANVPLDEIALALENLIIQGKVRAIGCSNYSATQLADMLTIQRAMGFHPMVSIQPSYNLIQREIEAETIPLCTKEQIGILSFSPLGAGFLTGKYTKGGLIPTGTRFDVAPAHQDVYFSDENFAIVEELRSRAAESGQSMVQLALAWALIQTGITSVLIGARNTDQVDQAFKAENLAQKPEIQSLLARL